MSSASKGNQKTSLRPDTNADFDDRPLWNHVKVLSTASGGGGNRTWTCNYCNKKVIGSYSKVRAHLLRIPKQGVDGCKSLNDEVAAMLLKEHTEGEEKKEKSQLVRNNQSQYLNLPPNIDLIQQKKRKGADGPGPLEKSFNVAHRDTADKLAARMFYASALPFNLVRSPYFIKYSQHLANSSISGYTPPSYNRLRTTLLAQEKTHINAKLKIIKDNWRRKGVSICSDGWTDIQRRPLINIMAASDGMAVFLKSVNASGNIKDADYVAGIFKKAVEEIDAKNVVQIVTDNASNYKAAGSLIEKEYPHIFWTPCVVHSINLALKRMCSPPENSDEYQQCKWISGLISNIEAIRNFVLNHDMANAIFNSYSKLKLLKVSETRFASSIVMASRLKEVREALEKMVMDSEWKHYNGDNKSIQQKAREVKSYIVDDVWWDNLDYLLKFTSPIIDMLRKADTDAPILHMVYDMWDSMIEKVKVVIFEQEGKDLLSDHSEFFDVVHTILETRWNKSNTPLHCMAHSLVPKYYGASWLREGNANMPRVAPHEDQEVSLNRNKCFERLFPNDVRQIYFEYGQFSSESGYFNNPHVLDARDYEEPLSWWANHGASTPLLQSLAFKLLSQPASSSCCERNWSTYSLIQNVKRNKLHTQRAEDLVFVHNNIRLLSRKKEEYVEGPSKFWDICGDSVDVDEDIEELANLSLNEPVLQVMNDEGTRVEGGNDK